MRPLRGLCSRVSWRCLRALGAGGALAGPGARQGRGSYKRGHVRQSREERQHRGRIWKLRLATSPRVTCDLPLSLSSRLSQLPPVWGSQTESRVHPVVSVVPKELGLQLPLMSRQRPGCRWPVAPSMPSAGQTCTPTALHLLFSQLNYAISLLTPGRGMACFEKLLMPSLANPGASQSPEATLVQTPEVLHGPARDTSG